MAASTEQKLDYLLKKIGYTASKTGLAEDSSLSGTKKAPFAEAIPSPLVTPSTTIWNESALIPTTPPGSDTAQVRVYLAGTSGHRMTVDSTVSGSRAFIAYSTYNNTSTAILGDWIDPQFGDAYIIKVYKGDPNSGGTLLSAAGAGSNDTWFFDYSSGVLNFNGTVIPSGVTDTNIYIVGYRYIGVKGLSTAGITTSGTSTLKDLNVTGVSTFAGNINANGNIIGDNSTNISGINSVTATSLFANLTGNVSGIATYTSEWIVTSNGSSDYRFTGPGFDATENDPTIYLARGQQYKFTNHMGAHPFEIRTAINGSAYNDGVVNNGVSNGTLTWDVQMDAPNVLYYQCTSHAGMVGKIYIGNSGNSINVGSGVTITGGGIDVTGVITATSFSGTLQTAAQPNITSVGTLTSLNVTGNVSIGGTLTYEDVTNIDSVGLITARTGIKVLAGGINAVGVVTATSFDGSLATTNLTGTITNAQLAGSIANDKLANSTVSYGGVSLALGSSDATPAFNLTDATNYPFTSLTGITTVIFGDTTPKLGGDLNGNSKNIYSVGILTATTFSGNISGVGATFTNITGTLQTASQTNITSVGTLGALTVSGNINANGNIVGDNSTNITGIAGVTATTLTGTLQTAAQTNITSVGTLGSLIVSGNINANGNIVGDNATNISGINSVTAVKFFGDGEGLTNVGVDTVTVNTNSVDTGTLNVSGISTFSGVANFNNQLNALGDVNIGNATSDTLSVTSRIDTSLVPTASGTRNLGQGDRRWHLYGENITVSGVSTFSNDINVSGVSTFVGIATFQSVDINQGTIDGTNIGFNHRANAQFLSVDASTTLGVDGTSTLNNLNVTGVSTFADTINLGDGDRINFLDTNTSIRAETEGLLIDSAGSKNIQIHVNAAGGSAGDFIVKSSGNELFKIDAGDVESTFTSTDTGSSAGPVINLYRNSASPADADYLGQIKFQGESDTGVQRNYAKITGKILDASNGTEDGILEFAFLKAGSNNISGRFRSDSLQLLNGTNFSVAGDSTFTGDINANGNIVGDNSTNITGIAGVTASTLTGTLQTAAQTNITSVGTLTSLNVTGDVSIGGTLTYEDVTNIDSIGIVTARTGIKVLAGGINAVGVVTGTNGLSGTILTAAQTNITSVGTLSALTVSGNINANGNIIGDNSTNISGIASITVANRIAHTGDDHTSLAFGPDTISHVVGGVTRFSVNGNTSEADFTVNTVNLNGNLNNTGISTFAGNINANGNIVGDNATNISGINSVTASAFYGDGSNLSNVGFTTSVGTFNASSGVATIDSFAHATEDYKVAEYTLHFTNGSNIQAQKLLVMQDGTTAYSQEFAVMSSGSQLVSVDSAISGANVLVRATPESGISGTTTFRWRRIVQE